MYVKPYNCYIKKIDIIILTKANNLAEKPIKKFLCHLKIQKRKVFINKSGHGKVILQMTLNKMVGIFISHREYVNYKHALKLIYDRNIITSKDLFERLDLVEIKSLLANSILQPLQYD